MQSLLRGYRLNVWDSAKGRLRSVMCLIPRCTREQTKPDKTSDISSCIWLLSWQYSGAIQSDNGGTFMSDEFLCYI